MSVSKLGILVAVGLVVMAFSAGSAQAWNYGDSWIIPLDPGKNQNGNAGLQGNWNLETSGGAAENGGNYWWASGMDSIRRARWFFDNSIHGGDAPTSAEKFLVQTWVPNAHSTSYQPIEVSFDGLGDEEATNNPNIPWAGMFGTNHQWQDRHQANQGTWVIAGPGPQAEGPYMYAQAGSYFWVKANYPWYDGPPAEEYGVSAIRITVIPEPGSMLALGGGLLSMAGLMIRRRK